MRVYVPVIWVQLVALRRDRMLVGPVAATMVDPMWRAGEPDVEEDVWENEAAEMAAEAVLGGGSLGRDPEPEQPRDRFEPLGMVLAVEVPDNAATLADDGQITIPAGIRWRDVAAVLSADLAWYGAQELQPILDARASAAK